MLNGQGYRIGQVLLFFFLRSLPLGNHGVSKNMIDYGALVTIFFNITKNVLTIFLFNLVFFLLFHADETFISGDESGVDPMR